MGMPAIKIWAKLQYFLNTGDGKPWDSGFSPSKVQPPQGLIDEGIRPEDPFRAEHENWYRNHLAKALQDAAMQGVSTAQKRGNHHVAFASLNRQSEDDRGGNFEWCGFNTSTANTAERLTKGDLDAIETVTSAGLSGAYNMVLGGVNRSVAGDSDYFNSYGVVYHAHGQNLFRAFDTGFAPFQTSVVLPGALRYGFGNAVKTYDNDNDIFPVYDSGTLEGSISRRTGSATQTNTAYAGVSAGGRNALAAAHMVKRRKQGSIVQPIYAITQNQKSSGNKCVIVRINNSAGFGQSLIYEGAELYGAGLEMYCAPVFCEAIGKWVIVTTNMPYTVNPNDNRPQGFNVYHAADGALQSPTLVAQTTKNVSIVRLGNMGNGFLIAIAAVERRTAESSYEIMVSPDSGITWCSTGRSLGFATQPGGWQTNIGPNLPQHNQFWINQSFDYDIAIGSWLFTFNGSNYVAAAGQGSHILIPSAKKLIL